ncbi:hypothetical protein M501DRAFT_1006686 [Patellaria atrata CBS 101060]|uniref:C2H2-type domain-containing protein n=1 Tax=Patellaria atrata CBS 101060 TaxID=1346257 RepID=A0A9P4S9H6_9PEZI|nr:hypothetical protein M501DRAFT_1006686 [Patellaria atrata CBS 101060]
MADVRSLLRDNRAARRIRHPQATYTTNGILTCNVCNTSLKSDANWEPHIRSPQHTTSLQKAVQRGAPPAAPSNKKRKASSDDELDENMERKKVKPPPINGFVREMTTEEEATESETADHVTSVSHINAHSRDDEVTLEPDTPSTARPLVQDPPLEISQAPPISEVDEDEWAAFERDIADPPPGSFTLAGLNAVATIEAAPMTTQEIAAQAREEQSLQKGKRDAELEAEKEDAARQMEEELDEMEALEQRVQKLKEKREAIRRAQGTENKAVDPLLQSADVPNVTEQDDSDEDEDEDADEWDGWRFGLNKF